MATVGEWAGGWRTLLAGFLAMATAWNVVSIALSVFLKPMQADLGWSRTALSIAPLASLLNAFMLPVTGLLLDRFGARRVAIAGTVAMACAMALFAIMPPSLVYFATLVILLACAGAAINSFVLARGVAGWFTRSLGTALGILLTGVSAGLALLVPAIATFVARFGWRAGFLAFAAWAMAFSLPVLVALFREPAQASTYGAVASTAGQRDSFAVLFARGDFQKLAAACLIAAIPIGGSINHLLPMLSDRGLSAAAAAQFASVFAIAIGAGGLGGGVLFDRLPPPLVAAMALVLAACGTTLLCVLPTGVASGEGLGLMLAVGLIGIAPGIEGDYINYFSNRLFGLPNFARVASVMALTICIGMATGGLAFAATFDRWGNYGPAMIGSIILYLVAAAIFLTIRMPRRDAAA